METIEQTYTAWYVLGPWTGYIVGIMLSIVFVLLNKKI